MVNTWERLVQLSMETLVEVGKMHGFEEEKIVRGGLLLVPPSINCTFYPITGTRPGESGAVSVLTAAIDVMVTVEGSSSEDYPIDSAIPIVGAIVQRFAVACKNTGVSIVHQFDSSGNRVNEDQTSLMIQFEAPYKL